MPTPRFLIAKYAADLRRMEPRNIGVILWSEGNVVAKFLDSERSPEHRRLLSRLRLGSEHAYSQWISSWRMQIAKPELPVRHTGAMVAKASPHFLDAMLAKSRGNYMLVDGGHLLRGVDAAELQTVLDELFATLVEAPESPAADEEQSQTRLREACDQVLEEAGLKNNNDFRRRFPVQCRVANTQQEFTFSYALADGSPYAVFHRVAVRKPEIVNSTAFMFECVSGAGILPKERCSAFVFVGPEAQNDPHVASSLDLLSAYGTVVNTFGYRPAVDQVKGLAKPLKHA